MFQIVEEKSPFLYESPKKNLLKNLLPVANLAEEEDLSFDEVSKDSSEIDEKEDRIIRFLEEEEIEMSNPKDKALEYAERIKEKMFLLHSKPKKDHEQKRFTLDNADLYNKRRSSCFELSGKFFSPDNMKSSKKERFDDNDLSEENLRTLKLKSYFKRTPTNPFALKTFKSNGVGEEEKEMHDFNKKNKHSPTLIHDFLSEMKFLKPKGESPNQV